jgi:carboxynorspermidine decarboxylase
MDLHRLKSHITVTPAFVIDEAAIIEALEVLTTLRQQTGCKMLFSVKALPLSSVLELAKPYVDGFSVSSLFEARLASEILARQGSLHLSTPGIRADEIAELNQLCSHISFNSLSQYQRFSPATDSASSGIRINPKLSFLADNRFNPCREHSKLGADLDEFCSFNTTTAIEGLHFHTVFSATNFSPLIQTVTKLEAKLGQAFKQLQWLNLGGGYLFKQIADPSPFVALLNRLAQQQATQIYIEPGKAIVGEAGHLITSVIDVFQSDGKTVAILDTSVNHQPEVFEYQKPPLLHEHDPQGQYGAILAGCTCLAGDVFGEYRFSKPVAIGDRLIFKNLGAYSLVKANRFNGYNLPDIYMFNSAGLKKVKNYHYADYRQQWQVT